MAGRKILAFSVLLSNFNLLKAIPTQVENQIVGPQLREGPSPNLSNFLAQVEKLSDENNESQPEKDSESCGGSSRSKSPPRNNVSVTFQTSPFLASSKSNSSVSPKSSPFTAQNSSGTLNSNSALNSSREKFQGPQNATRWNSTISTNPISVGEKKLGNEPQKSQQIDINACLSLLSPKMNAPISNPSNVSSSDSQIKKNFDPLNKTSTVESSSKSNSTQSPEISDNTQGSSTSQSNTNHGTIPDSLNNTTSSQSKTISDFSLFGKLEISLMTTLIVFVSSF